MTLSIASSEEDAPPSIRAAIRDALAEAVDQLHLDLSLIKISLDGPDPEFALALLVDALRPVPAVLGRLEAALSALAVKRAA